MKTKKLELGCKVEDIVTGFKGIVIGITVYLTGCDVVGIKPTELKNGRPQDATWIDMTQLKVIAAPNSALKKLVAKKVSNGGPKETPPSR